MLVIEREQYLADTDATGFVDYARYLEWMEACRLDILSAIGSRLDQLKTSGLNAVVLSAACEYKAPIKLGDTVQIQCFIKKFKKSKC